MKNKGNVTKLQSEAFEDVCVTDVLQDLFNRHEFRYDMKW